MPLAMLAVGTEAPRWDLPILLGPPVTALWRRQEKPLFIVTWKYDVICLFLGPLNKNALF